MKNEQQNGVKMNRAQRLSMVIVNAINAAELPKSALQMSVKQIQYGWNVSAETAQEIRWILTENWK